MQTAHCPDHGLEEIVKAWYQRPIPEVPNAMVVLVGFPCKAHNNVVMSKRTFEDVHR